MRTPHWKQDANSICLLFNPKPHDARRLERALRSSGITKSYWSITPHGLARSERALRLICERLRTAAVNSGSGPR